VWLIQWKSPLYVLAATVSGSPSSAPYALNAQARRKSGPAVAFREACQARVASKSALDILNEPPRYMSSSMRMSSIWASVYARNSPRYMPFVTHSTSPWASTRSWISH